MVSMLYNDVSISSDEQHNNQFAYDILKAFFSNENSSIVIRI